MLAENYIECLLKTVEDIASPDVVCFNFAQFSGSEFRNNCNLKKSCFKTKEQMKSLHRQIVTGSLTGSLWSKVFKSSLIKGVTIDEAEVSEKRFGEDAYHSFAVMFCAESVSFIEDILYYYRDNPQGASLGYSERDFDYFNINYVFKLIEDFLMDNYSEADDLLKMLYAHNFNATVNHMLKFYRNSKSTKRKKQIVEYCWASYLLEKTLDNIELNENVRQSYLKVWKAFNRKAHSEIYIREKFKRVIGW